MELRGKKLLYLGGIPRARYVVERARKMGIYVIVADYLENNPAKEVADEAALIDALDIDKLEELCRMNKVDGIFSGYVDIILPCWKELCRRLQLPCYIEDRMLFAATDKVFFKELCKEYNLPVPQTYYIDKNNIEQSAKELVYPVFIKPLDASGSRGADVCLTPEEFSKKYKYALSFSKKGFVTVEDFLQGTEFILDYMLINGRPYLASMADRYTNEGHSAAINCCNLMIFPSRHLERYIKDVHPLVCNMFSKENFRNGVIFLQGYASNSIHFYEMGCRLGGTWPYIDEYFHNVNPLDMLFRHALTGEMLLDDDDADNITARFNGNAAVIYFMAKKNEGTIKTVRGLDEVKKMKYVVSILEYYKSGDHFSIGTLTDVLILGVHLVADNFKQLKERVNEIYSLVDYLDESDESVLSPRYDINQLEQYY